MRVRSTDETDVVVHDLGGEGRPLLLSHATGFHGRCYRPVAAALADRFHSHALDYRGHGDTQAPDDWAVDWNRYTDDAMAAAHAIAPDGRLIAFGHSMGGACLLMAAHRDPSLFELIVAYEPIVFPPAGPGAEHGGSPLAAGARRRRRTFASFDEAIENYGAKPPMQHFRRDALEAYVIDGFRPEDDGVVVKCEPEHEARTFEAGGSHRTWELLPEITTRVVVVAGKSQATDPAALARGIADRLPNGAYIELTHLDHFGPMTHPDEVAALIRTAAG